MNTGTMKNVGGIFIAMTQHCALDLLIVTKAKKYGPRKGRRQYVRTGGSVGVVMDTTKTKGELSFSVNDIEYNVAFDGIPLDKPLVPCVLLYWKDDSVELIT